MAQDKGVIMIEKVWEEIADEDKGLGWKPRVCPEMIVIAILLILSGMISFLAIKGAICLFTH
jgi:hypothetical protein